MESRTTAMSMRRVTARTRSANFSCHKITDAHQFDTALNRDINSHTCGDLCFNSGFSQLWFINSDGFNFFQIENSRRLNCCAKTVGSIVKRKSVGDIITDVRDGDRN